MADGERAMKLRAFWDCLYPMAESAGDDEVLRTTERDAARLVSAQSHVDPKAIADAYAVLRLNETDRLSSVEARLSSVLGLTSITASLLVGGTFALVNGGLSDSSLWVRLVAAAALLYLNLQIVCSTIATIRGLRRKTWNSLAIEDLVPAPDVKEDELSRRLATQSCERLTLTEANVNYKVTQMTIAHTAIRNFAAGSALIAALGFTAVVLQRPGSATAKAIRNDTEIQKLLRGPQGPPGPAGPKGESRQPMGPATSNTAKVHKNP